MASGSSDPMEDLGGSTDVEPLKRAWRNEKAAPEILRFETHLIDRVSEQIQLMVLTVLLHGPAAQFQHSRTLSAQFFFSIFYICRCIEVDFS